MQISRKTRASSDRTLNRLIIGAIAILVIGVPMIGVLYFLDQGRASGPSILERSTAAGEEAVRKNPNQIASRLQLASVYLAADRYADAIAQYDEVLKAQPENRGALMGHGLTSISLEALDVAKTDFQKVVDLAKGGEQANVDPQLEAAYYQLGVVAIAQGQAQAAKDSLEQALRISRTDADALNLYATALLQTGEPQLAVESLRKAVALVPSGWCQPYTQLAVAFTALGDPIGTQYATGMVAACEERPDEAKAALQPLVDGPFGVDALLGIGLIAEDQGDATTATAAYTKVLTTDPQNFAAIGGLNRLGAAPSAAPSSTVAPPSPSAAGSN